MNAELQEADEKPLDTGEIPHFSNPLWGPMTEQAVTGAGQFQQAEELHPALPPSLPSLETGSNNDEPAQRAPSSVPIPRANSQTQVGQVTSPTGPMSTGVHIPPRPRPGRKPIPQEDAADRRRLQNRIAQRNFRDKRQQRLLETQNELQERRKLFEHDIGDLENQLQELRDGKKVAEQQKESLKKRCRELEARNHFLEQRLRQVEIPGIRGSATSLSTGSAGTLSNASVFQSQPRTYGPFTGGGGGGLDAITPPDERFSEIDFTTYSNRTPQSVPNTNNFRPSFSNDSSQMTFGMEMQSGDDEDNCGFCTDAQNCACKQEARAAEPVLQAGTCAECLRNPVQAAVCRQLATAGGFRPVAAEESRILDASSMPPPKVSCSEIVGQLGQSQRRLSSATKVLSEQRPQAFPAPEGGFLLAEQVAIQALRDLSRQAPPDIETSRLPSDAKPSM